MRRVFDLIERLADSDITVLITGESGTGKELVAKAIHNQGARAQGRFVSINCAAMPGQLLESELFGHTKGSFTGADRHKEGLFVAAEGGTLLLDEIGEMPMEMQPKLLRVLEERTVRPVGATRETPIDVRVLAATNRDLKREATEGRFREDLFYRLNVIEIEIPPLRERTEDIQLLSEHFLHLFAEANPSSEISAFSRETVERFEHYAWPGNVRELENAVRRAATLETGDTIQVESLPEALRGEGPGEGDLQGQMMAELLAATREDGGEALIPAEGLDLEGHLEQIRRTYMLRALEEAGGVQKKAAAKVGMSFRSFRYYLDKLGIR